MSNAKLQVLLIQPWIADQRAVRAALRAGGIDVELTSVDFEAALNAAVSRGGFALAIYDPGTPGLSRETVDACLRANRCELPVVALGDLVSLATRVLAALAPRGN